MPEDITVCMGVSTFFAIVAGTIILMRWFKHREIVTLAQKGLLPEQYARYMSVSRGRGGRGLLGWGVALAALGLALIIGLWPIGFATGSGYPLGFGPWMLIGLIPLFLGLALLIFYFVVRKEEASATEPPAEEAEVVGD
jgi:hypothetical protein